MLPIERIDLRLGDIAANHLDIGLISRVRNAARGSQRLRPLNYLLSREIVSEMLARLLPRSFLLRVRRWKEQGAFPREGRTMLPDDEREDLAVAREVLAADISYVGAMFADAPVILGDGRSVITRGRSAANPGNGAWAAV